MLDTNANTLWRCQWQQQPLVWLQKAADLAAGTLASAKSPSSKQSFTR